MILAERFGVAKETVARAHAWLAQHGYVVTVPGVGMVVTPPERWKPESRRPRMYLCGVHLPGIAAPAFAEGTLLPPAALAACTCVFLLGLSTVIRAVSTPMFLFS